MSEVRRWKLKGFIPGIEGESKAVFQPTVVLEEDYDAALAREAALREELENVKRSSHNANAALNAAIETSKLWKGRTTNLTHAKAGLQQRLTDAERRLSTFESLMLESNELLYVIHDGLGPNLGAEVETMRGKVFTALKLAEGEGS